MKGTDLIDVFQISLFLREEGNVIGEFEKGRGRFAANRKMYQRSDMSSSWNGVGLYQEELGAVIYYSGYP
jgi:hypothetical protein